MVRRSFREVTFLCIHNRFCFLRRENKSLVIISFFLNCSLGVDFDALMTSGISCSSHHVDVNVTD